MRVNQRRFTTVSDWRSVTGRLFWSARMNIKDAAREQIEKVRQPLIDLSHRIHAHPELGFEEEKACGWLCEMLDHAGFKVERGICELPTAFVARAGNGPLHLT